MGPGRRRQNKKNSDGTRICLPVGGAYHLYVDVCMVLATRANGNDRGGGVSSRYALLMTRICILPQSRWDVQVHLLYFSGFKLSCD